MIFELRKQFWMDPSACQSDSLSRFCLIQTIFRRFQWFWTLLEQTVDRMSLWQALGSIQDGLLNSTPIQCHFKIINIKLQPTKVFPGNVAIIFAVRKRSTLDFAWFRRFPDDFGQFRTLLEQNLGRLSLWQALGSTRGGFRNSKPVQYHFKISQASNSKRIACFPRGCNYFCRAETTYTGFPAWFRRFSDDLDTFRNVSAADFVWKIDNIWVVVNGIVFPHNYSLCNSLGGIRSWSGPGACHRLPPDWGESLKICPFSWKFSQALADCRFERISN